MRRLILLLAFLAGCTESEEDTGCDCQETVTVYRTETVTVTHTVTVTETGSTYHTIRVDVDGDEMTDGDLDPVIHVGPRTYVHQSVLTCEGTPYMAGDGFPEGEESGNQMIEVKDGNGQTWYFIDFADSGEVYGVLPSDSDASAQVAEVAACAVFSRDGRDSMIHVPDNGGTAFLCFDIVNGAIEPLGGSDSCKALE